MSQSDHDRAVRFIAANRFPFPDQTDWPAGYTTLTNETRPTRGIPDGDGLHYPDIVILDERGVPVRLGEVEMAVDDAAVARWRLGSDTADTMNETGVKNLFVYVPAGLGAAAVKALDDNAISFAGVREFTVVGEAVAVLPLLTRGDRYDHR